MCGIRGNSQAANFDVNTVLPEGDNKIDQAAKRLDLVLTWCKVYSKTWGRTAYNVSLTGSSVQQIMCGYRGKRQAANYDVNLVLPEEDNKIDQATKRLSIVFRPNSALCVSPDEKDRICAKQPSGCIWS
jgi:uncharacterized protein YgfB (UPF0149 family)